MASSPWKSEPVPKGRRGLLIVFEGIDGAGKTTQAKALTTYFNQSIPDSAVYQGFPGYIHWLNLMTYIRQEYRDW